MALRLGDYILYGELNNTQNFSTFGHFVLAGEETPYILDLTGNCSPDLRGKRIRFQAAPSFEHPLKLPKIAGHLIGVTGTMTAEGWVKSFECSREEYIRRAGYGEPPPTTWTRHLYLEFYTQHGRTLIELGGPLIEYEAGGGDTEDWRPLPEVERSVEEAFFVHPSPDIEIIHSSGKIEQVDPREYLEQHGATDPLTSLQRLLDSQTEAIERAIHDQDQDADDTDGCLAELELMDYLMEHETGDPLSLAFSPRRLPSPEDVPDEKIEPLLKTLLAELALYGVALHVCRHFSLRDTYRLLVENLHDEWRFHPQLAGTGWVQNYMTSEYCDECEKEAMRDYEECNKRGEQAPPPDDKAPS